MNIKDNMVHYKSRYRMWKTACGIVSTSDPIQTTRNKKKVTCKKCKGVFEFKQKKFLKRIRWSKK